MGGIETDLLKYYSEAEIILINTCYFNHKPQHGNAANFNYFLRINFSYFSISTRPSIENIHAYRRIFLRCGDVLFWKYGKITRNCAMHVQTMPSIEFTFISNAMKIQSKDWRNFERLQIGFHSIACRILHSIGNESHSAVRFYEKRQRRQHLKLIIRSYMSIQL